MIPHKQIRLSASSHRFCLFVIARLIASRKFSGLFRCLIIIIKLCIFNGSCYTYKNLQTLVKYAVAVVLTVPSGVATKLILSQQSAKVNTFFQKISLIFTGIKPWSDHPQYLVVCYYHITISAVVTRLYF